jgi:hypothetical protein
LGSSQAAQLPGNTPVVRREPEAALGPVLLARRMRRAVRRRSISSSILVNVY